MRLPCPLLCALSAFCDVLTLNRKIAKFCMLIVCSWMDGPASRLWCGCLSSHHWGTIKSYFELPLVCFTIFIPSVRVATCVQFFPCIFLNRQFSGRDYVRICHLSSPEDGCWQENPARPHFSRCKFCQCYFSGFFWVIRSELSWSTLNISWKKYEFNYPDPWKCLATRNCEF